MAKGLDDLIEFLLEEIAVSGSQGVTINDIALFVSSFYDEPEDDSEANAPVDGPDPCPSVTVDRPLLSKIWLWLGRHPDVSIGDNRRYNKTPLAEVEIQFPRYLDLGLNNRQKPAEDEAESDGSHLASPTPNKRPSSKKAYVAKGPRISVNEARIYQAICGHPPDSSKVVPLEFELLSHIAAARSTGILQGDLVRATGQDKRSVPKRTDALQTKGYITKATVFRHGNRTSRLTLRKFARHNAVDAEPFHKLHSLPQHGSTLRDVVRRIFEVLEDHSLMSQTSLAENLSLRSSAESAILSKIIRRLEKMKCVKRVRTAIGPSATSGDLRQFVQLLRRADAADLENFDTESLSLNQTIEELASAVDSEDRNDHNDHNVALPTVEEANEDSLEAVYRPARWNPDRLMPNVLVDAVRFAGPDGLTNLNARQMITGDFVRRQLESLLLRVSCESLVIQPQHLRHLAIVRTTVRYDGVAQYVHYSWDAFRQRVAGCGLDPSEIPAAPQIMEKLAEKDVGFDGDGTSSDSVDIDEFGFPLQSPPAVQLRNGEATFSDLIEAVAPGDVKKRNGEPSIVRRGTNLTIKLRDDGPALSSPRNQAPRRLPPGQHTKPTRRLPKRLRDSDDEEKIAIGRPRKYMRGTEKFWRMQFKQARLDAGANHDDLKKGTAQDPSAIALYARRPQDFDNTLVQALQAGLPIPGLPQDINDAWIRSTRVVLGRSSDGVYMSPKGLRSDNNQRLAQRMIVRTPRLKSVDFSDRNIVYPFRFISSSVSHSSMFRRYYPNLPSKEPSVPHTPRRLKRPRQVALSEAEGKRKLGPRLGVFYEKPALSTTLPPLLPSSTDIELSADILMATTDEEEGLPRKHVLETRASSPASINETLSSKEAGLDNGRSRRGSQRTTQRQSSGPEIPPSPRSKLDITESPRIRSSRNRKLTQKAMDLLQSDQSHNFRLSETQNVSSEVIPADFELRNQDESLSRRSEVSAVDASSASSIEHKPTEEQQSGVISYSDMALTRISHCIQPSPASNKQMDPDGNYRVEATEAATVRPEEAQHVGTLLSRQLSEEIVEVAVSGNPSVSGEPQENNLAAEMKDRVSQESPVPPKPRIKKRASEAGRTRAASIEAGNSGEESRPKDRHGQERQRYVQQRYVQGANVLCQRIILELVQETSGVVPNDPSALRRISLPRWQEAGEEGRPGLKTIKAAIKSLNDSQRLKQVMFAFRGKSGTMVKRSVIFLPHIDSSSQSVEDVKQKIINAEPTDYIPPEWKDEGYRIPLVNKRAPTRTPEVAERPPRSRHASSAGIDGTIASSISRRARSRTRTTTPSLPPVPEDPATSFLTLKVPSLGSLPVVHLHEWRKECPVSALRSDTSDANPWKSSAFLLSRHRRRFEEPRTQPAGRSIIWRNFPSSLQDILQCPNLKLDYDAFQADDVDWQRFACEVEGVRAWEEQEPDTAQSKRSKFAFINHLVPNALYARTALPLAVEFKGLVQFDEDGIELEIAYPPVESWPTFVLALNASPGITSRIAAVNEADLHLMPPLSPGRGPRRSNRGTKRRISENGHGFFPPPPSKRRRKGVGGSAATPSRRRAVSAFNATIQKVRRSARWLHTMPEEMISRIAVAVIVVRTLAGGIESLVNWEVVMTLFPNQKEEIIKARWNTLSNRYSSDIQSLTADLQSKYLKALQAGEVSSVAFEGVNATDWGAIVEWALKNLDHFNLKRIADLPANRDELLDTYALEFTQPKCFHNVVWNNTTMNVKEDVAKCSVFGTYPHSSVQPGNLRYQHGFELEMAKADLRLAKSWVLATIFTPESVFNPELAHAKLSTLALSPMECDVLLSRALKLLQEEKIIQRRLNDRPSEQGPSIRSWEAHRKFFERFEERSTVTPNVLRRAVRYKSEVLDREFARGNTVVVDKEGPVSDGEMVAVLNLMASGRVKLRPGADVPKTRYGIDHERIGYRTKNMDKKLLGFSIELTPTKEYLFGDSISGESQARRIAVPRGDADEPSGKIPVWVDIHGNVQMTLWHMLLVGVIGLVSQMPGVSALDISRAFGFVPDEAEVELIMQWCIQSGFAKMDDGSKGYQTLEWWWLCVDKAGTS
ncbi:uncharacterized protein A1O5_12551 [Cladophialophora psammophila CBS 110553]|uniref:Uncharacterized protein n=1 Tax=Cladophialophora psammophila CBS 110553 TaxID=1182543 RepID=W9WCN3_9EURO|nr:uncharacterized protein A1O5_12551 [Cladophialophora psammophila CBS 110553]EXJ56284.1 hypothetical protein A1O5_12551 [Cladophialophora psammophila CBS 110553]